MSHELIYHVALASDWAVAQRTGEYAVSTLGRSLSEEGFIHASRADQWAGVLARFYADVTDPLVLLVVDRRLLRSEVRDEAVPDSDETFPHVYGPIDVGAVVEVRALDASRDQ
ncbi:MAG TPA: DUF952 domain-containing protein [Marmoricola sp.]|nr:DUF952 domain-containing protein [Marmoricola sp.]